MPKKTFFGYKEVEEEEKPLLVDQVFSSVADKYDIMNDIMSLGIHRLWKNKFINSINPKAGDHLIDVAGGTGDIAIRFLKKNPETKVTLCDINFNMIKKGYNKIIDNNLTIENISTCCSDATQMPFSDNKFDFYTIAFGIRNISKIDKALKEAKRVLKPGGKFLCLEFSNVENSFISQIYDLFSFSAIPKIGKVIANDSESYQYLVESIRKFPNKELFAKMIEDSGFSQVKYKSLTHGIAAIHSGWKI